MTSKYLMCIMLVLEHPDKVLVICLLYKNKLKWNIINDILKYDVYEEVCNKLQLVINKENYDKCKVLFENRSHL